MKPALKAIDWNTGRVVLDLALRIRAVHPLWVLVTLIWLTAAVLLVQWLPSLQARHQATETQKLQLQTQLLNQANEPAQMQTHGTQENLQLFMSNLGEPRHVEQQLKTLFVIAQDLELKLTQGQYKLTCEDNIDYCKYTIVLPIEGSYVRIRAFVEQSLAAIAFASVDEISFRRESVGDSDVQARLRISLYTRTLPTEQRPAAPRGQGL